MAKISGQSGDISRSDVFSPQRLRRYLRKRRGTSALFKNAAVHAHSQLVEKQSLFDLNLSNQLTPNPQNYHPLQAWHRTKLLSSRIPCVAFRVFRGKNLGQNSHFRILGANRIKYLFVALRPFIASWQIKNGSGWLRMPGFSQ